MTATRLMHLLTLGLFRKNRNKNLRGKGESAASDSEAASLPEFGRGLYAKICCFWVSIRIIACGKTRLGSHHCPIFGLTFGVVTPGIVL